MSEPIDPTLSDALQEAYAVAGDETLIHTMSIFYEGLVDDDDNPSELYIFDGANSDSMDDDGVLHVSVKLENDADHNAGEIVDCVGIGFECTPPNVTSDPQPVASITIDNVSQDMVNLLLTAAQAGKSIQLTYRQFIVDNKLLGPENQPPLKFRLTDVSIGSTSVSGNLVSPIIGNRRFPYELYTATRFKTLQNG